MRRSDKGFLSILWITAALCCAGPSFGDDAPRYPRDLAQKIYSVPQITDVLKLEETLITTSPAPILVNRAVPLGDLDVVPESGKTLHPNLGSWEVPPFPEVAPPPPSGLTPAALAAWKKLHELTPEAQPAVFGDISPDTQEVPSRRLHPRTPVPSGETISQKDFQLPVAFSSVRFASNRMVFQLSLYAGTTSFEAEQAFKALRHSVDKREPLEGFGKDAFLAQFKEVDPDPPPVLNAGSHAFEEVAPIGGVHPEQTDEGLLVAKKAPAFGEVPTTLYRTSGAYVPRVTQPRPAPSLREYLLVVAYVPEKAITYELAMDTRLGTMQNLLQMALGVNRRISEL